jgi:hemerythrin-like domain-containing protein
MKPIAPLLIEHRLIEKMVGVLQKESTDVSGGRKPDTPLIYVAVDFFRVYADKTHHGKEEDILFRDLSAKPLSEEHIGIVAELLEEHALARKNVAALFDANLRYEKGDSSAVSDMSAAMKILTQLYPVHIEKEDKRFFIPVMDYFTQDEQDKMLREFYLFDRNLIVAELMEEHVLARKNISALDEANNRYEKGDPRARSDMVSAIKTLTKMYPEHVEKEDKIFFIPVLEHVPKEEQDKILHEFYLLDRNMVHEKYKKVVNRYVV